LILGFLRNKYRDNKRRDLINDLHFWHRTTYMGERQAYYERQEANYRYPSTFMSDISDGMSGDKTKVPSLSDAYDFKPPLSMHVRFYRSIFLYLIFIYFNLAA
jgi:hypothetical protein